MNNVRSIWILAFSVCLFAGCQQTPPDTRAQDERAIRQVDASTLKAAQAKDIGGVIANYAEDATWLPPNAPIVNGKAGIRAGWSGIITTPGFNIDWQIDKLEIAQGGDLAYVIDTYQLAFNDPKEKPINDHGKDMVVWKKQPDGNWKIVAEAFSSNVPLAAPAPATASQPKRAAPKRRPSKKHPRTR